MRSRTAAARDAGVRIAGQACRDPRACDSRETQAERCFSTKCCSDFQRGDSTTRRSLALARRLTCAPRADASARRAPCVSLRRATRDHWLDGENDTRGRHRMAVEPSVETELRLGAAPADRKRLVAAEAELRATIGVQRNYFRHLTTPS